MHVVNLTAYRSKGLVSAIEQLLALAKSGEIDGLSYVARFGPHDHRAGAAGAYRESPEQALQATFLMERSLRRDLGDFSDAG